MPEREELGLVSSRYLAFLSNTKKVFKILDLDLRAVTWYYGKIYFFVTGWEQANLSLIFDSYRSHTHKYSC